MRLRTILVDGLGPGTTKLHTISPKPGKEDDTDFTSFFYFSLQQQPLPCISALNFSQ